KLNPKRFDGFDERIVWQMLPLQDSSSGPDVSRQVILDLGRHAGGALRLSLNDPSVAEFTEVDPPPQPRLRAFNLVGKKVGRANLEARDDAGKVQAFLQVAVKPRIAKKVALFQVKDSVRQTERSV